MTKPKHAFAEAYGPAAPAAPAQSGARRAARSPRSAARGAKAAPKASATAQEQLAGDSLRHDAPHATLSKPSAAFVARSERPTLPGDFIGEQRGDVHLELPATDSRPPAADLNVRGTPVDDLSWLEAMNRAAAGLAQWDTAWEPALEVPHFAWPAAVVELLSVAQSDVRALVGQLTASEGGPRRVVFFTGGGPGSGCTTTLLTVARAAADAGQRVALVDADFAEAALATRLGLRIETGWPTALQSDLPLGEALVESLEDRAVVAPLAGPWARPETLLASPALPRLWRELADRFDLVLVDAGSLTRASQVAALIGDHAPAELVFVQDTRRPVATELNHALRCFPNLRACSTSIAQNFVQA